MAAEPNAPVIGAPRRERKPVRHEAPAPIEAAASIRGEAPAPIDEQADVEAEVLLTLYGDPARRHRAYATRGHDRPAQQFGGVPDRSRA